MLSYPRGYVAFACGMILIAGHFLSFGIVWLNSSISPTAKSDVIALIIPITVASVTSAILYAAQYSEIDLGATPKVNPFFLVVSIFIPLLFFAIILIGLANLDGEESVKNFKIFIVSAEAAFGGIFVIVTEALFGSRSEDES